MDDIDPADLISQLKTVPRASRELAQQSERFNISKDDSCQHVQKGVSMKSCSKNFQLIGEETPSSVDNVFSNDSCFDPYSNFE